MLNQLQKLKTKKSQSGFTIIEVMIVLAIAGLIILIVLLAVPAVQRNSRNTAMKQDVSALIGGLSNYSSDNDGAIASGVSGTGTITITNGAATPITNTVKLQTGTSVTVVTAVPAVADFTTGGQIKVDIDAKCGAATTSRRSTAVYYVTETQGTDKLNCQET